MSSNYKYTEASVQVKQAAGKISGIFVNAASGTPTITVYDSFKSSASDPVVLGTFTPVAGTMYLLDGIDGIFLNNGLYVVITGTVKCTIFYQ